MAKNLVIVESPAKAKTIKKFLGTGYEVIASNGHVRDLPKSKMGIDTEHDFEPQYITIRGKKDVINALKKEAKKADRIYLATDPDREGEAISWHLAEFLKLDEKNYSRITFNEITKNAIRDSLKQARKIDMDLVDAQQARRVLDRLVGYRISPVIWAKVKSGLSAGRVQSVALRIIADREAQIAAFVPEEYWYIDADISGAGGKHFTAHLSGKGGKKIDITSEKQAEEIKKALSKARFSITDIRRGERKRKAPLPFTTSTLQQEASKLLNFSTQKTMQLAQQLYEGVDVKGHGTIGLITYLRTDSTRISAEADQAAREHIARTFGEKYLAEKAVEAGNGRKIQDAHEAIRPSYVDLTPDEVKDSLQRDQYRLYKLIWTRFVASRMEQAVYETVNIKLDAAGYNLTAGAAKLAFDGFMSVYKLDEEVNRDEDNKNLSWITKDSEVKCESVTAEQHFTQPPAHFNEGSLVKTLEELGIGRPSTYAPTITTIIARHYVAKENKNLYITELGEAVNNIMMKSFPSIVDVNFTATMEGLLDAIENGEVKWKTVIENFYPDLEVAVEAANKELEKVKIKYEETDIICDQCGSRMVIKYGPHGKFLACPNFPECRNTKPLIEKTGQKCPKCGTGDVLIMKTKKGRRFYGCSNHPDCDFVSWQKPDVPVVEEQK